jgi:23S rRNA (cytidine1920-2'-O)/16S rRNA (cytidine1409-2'-O)-methyltransferase
MRLDIHLTKFYNIQSRNKANELIKDKKILIDGKIVTKPSYKIEDHHTVQIMQEEFYVSRSAYKLKYFLEDNNIEVLQKEALDIGSSTGGFTQVLLNKNIKNVTCVDVGSNQLHKTIKDDDRISMFENTDIRNFRPLRSYELVTCDVSFISILNILDDIHRLSNDKIIILYKPQFEVGKDIKRDNNGVVKDLKAIKQARDMFIAKTKQLNWELICCDKSKVSGKKGNIEELFYFLKL